MPSELWELVRDPWRTLNLLLYYRFNYEEKPKFGLIKSLFFLYDLLE